MKQFASHNLRENRNMAVYTYPEGLLSKPSNNVAGALSNSRNSSQLGFRTSNELRRAKEHLKGRAGVTCSLMLHIANLEDVRRICSAIHKSGCLLFVVGVGTDRNEEVLQSLCAHPDYYRTVERSLDISKYLIKLLIHE